MEASQWLPSVRALADGEEAYLRALEAAAPFDPVAYAQALDLHRLMPWVEPAVLCDAGRARLPAALVEAVAAGADTRQRRHDDLVRETLEVEDAYARAGIPCRHLKGLYFGRRFFGNPRRRHQRDVDVLVRERDRDGALEALERIGYVREAGEIKEGVVRWGMQRGYAQVDVHWNLRRRARRRVDGEDLLADPVSFELGGRTLATLPDDATLTFLLLSLCGDLRRGACRARHLVDLHLVLRGLGPGFDPEAFLARRKRQALAMPCLNVLAVFLSLWGAAQEFPALAAAVLRRRRHVQIRGVDDALGLLTRPGGGEESRRWFRRAYPYNRIDTWARRLTIDLPYHAMRLLPSQRFRLDEGIS
ncbi:MAG TPA: nucleotidyltransferase family protein [Myxococcota bacterium]|nr:nucleotidyltransferase family protein [Myxococcota bacterium]